MSQATNFSELKTGEQLIIQSRFGTIFELTVRHRDKSMVPHLTFLPVVINGIQGIGEHRFRVHDAAALWTASLGDVSTEEAFKHFQGKTNCTMIGEGYWVCLLQLAGVPAGIFRITALTVQR